MVAGPGRVGRRRRGLRLFSQSAGDPARRGHQRPAAQPIRADRVSSSVVVDPNSVQPAGVDPEIVRRREVILANVIKLMQTANNNPGGRNFEIATENLNELFDQGTVPADYALTPDSQRFLSQKVFELTNQDPTNVVKSFSSPKFIEPRRPPHRRLHALSCRGRADRRRGGRSHARPADLRLDGPEHPARPARVAVRPGDAPGAGPARRRAVPRDGDRERDVVGAWVGVHVALPPDRRRRGHLDLLAAAPMAMGAAADPAPARDLLDPRRDRRRQALPVRRPDRPGSPQPRRFERRHARRGDRHARDPRTPRTPRVANQPRLNPTAAHLAASPSKIGVLVDSSVGYFTPRMRLLQGQLRGEYRTILFRDPAEQAKHFAKALGPRSSAACSSGACRSRSRDLLFSDPNFVAATQASLQFFDGKYRLLFARTAQLRGELTAATDKYVALRFAENPVTTARTSRSRPRRSGPWTSTRPTSWPRASSTGGIPIRPSISSRRCSNWSPTPAPGATSSTCSAGGRSATSGGSARPEGDIRRRDRLLHRRRRRPTGSSPRSGTATSSGPASSCGTTRSAEPTTPCPRPPPRRPSPRRAPRPRPAGPTLPPCSPRRAVTADRAGRELRPDRS